MHGGTGVTDPFGGVWAWATATGFGSTLSLVSCRQGPSRGLDGRPERLAAPLTAAGRVLSAANQRNERCGRGDRARGDSGPRQLRVRDGVRGRRGRRGRNCRGGRGDTPQGRDPRAQPLAEGSKGCPGSCVIKPIVLEGLR